MLIKSFKLYALTLAGLAMIVAVFLTAPICYAGGAVTLMPADDSMAPEGSYISEDRKKKIEKEVTVHKAKMKAEAEKQQDQSLQSETPDSDAPKEK